MDQNPSLCWESILEKVREHIPTIDSDSSSSESEETISIFQRPAGLSLKVPEDFSFSLNDGDLEVEAWKRDSVLLNAAKLNASPKPYRNYQKAAEGFPVLSFERLNQWDLDHVLQNMKGDGLSLKQNVTYEPATSHADGDKNRSQESIMDKLVAFCKSQSSLSSSEPGKGLNLIRQKNVCNISPEQRLSHQKCPTVYIDLCCPDSSIKPLKTSTDILSEVKSQAKSNTHKETAPAQKLKVQTASQVRGSDMTGKSMLLHTTRMMKKKENANQDIHTDSTVQSRDAEESTEFTRHALEHLKEEESSHTQIKSVAPKRERTKGNCSSKIKKQEQQSDQQEQHQQILKQLTKHCPTMSVNKRQPAAEKTDVLYHVEASYLQPISTLPANWESKGQMMLIVNLSSPGMVEEAEGLPCPAATKSHIYNTLVAWFLSLVGPCPLSDEEEFGAIVPFWVAGLQQLWTEDGLALYVLAVARGSYTPKKKQRDIHTPFYDHVCRFLSETTLPVIAHWLPQLQTLLDQESYTSAIHLPSSILKSFIFTSSRNELIERIFGLSPAFYWQTVESQENVCKGKDSNLELHTEVSVALGCKTFFLDPLMTHYTLQLVLDSGLDVCGLRLLYPTQESLTDSSGAEPGIQTTDETCHPVLAMAVRGPHSNSAFQDVITSLYIVLPRKEDSTSASSFRCGNQRLGPLLSLQIASQVHRDLCLWFSGRLPGKCTQNDKQSLNRVVHAQNRDKGSAFNSNRSPSSLCATTKADLLLVVSPTVPPCCYSQVLAVCEFRGFSLMGLQRLQLQSNGAAVLGLSNQQALIFCSPTTTQKQKEQDLSSHCLVLMLRKENAMHHSVSLPSALMRQLKAENLLGCIHPRQGGISTVKADMCFHTVPYISELFFIFVRCMWTVPSPSHVILSRHKSLSTADMEQVVILTMCEKDMSKGLSLLHRVLTKGFKLLGLKFLPVLTRPQALEVTPYEVGEQLYNSSVEILMSSPVLVCALSQAEAFYSLRKLLPQDYPANLSVLMSATPEVAFRQASVFFLECEVTFGGLVEVQKKHNVRYQRYQIPIKHLRSIQNCH
ncbi:dynein axonemal-associated protein 1 [Cheilinus undulatus]|uniref:dynein axonemal-associated protein 1 n=1 Tax=Cheilinus undulatus TaxID=241271 RepID=UPI001BD379BD|nr:dynein axonemal-associated protein 1 [Cheilinus undulatus]